MIAKTYHYPDRTLNVLAEENVNLPGSWYVTVKRLDIYGNTDIKSFHTDVNGLKKYLSGLSSTSLNQKSIQFYQSYMYLNPDNFFDYCGCTYDMFNHRTMFTSQPNQKWNYTKN